MVTTYRYIVTRKADGFVYPTETITDIANQGMKAMVATVRSVFAVNHPPTRGGRSEEIDVEMWEAVPGR